jgi:uncharacterized repeat protein (TIGR01451 family)
MYFMKNLKLFSLTLLTVSMLFATATPAFAGNNQYGQYGQYGQQPGEEQPYSSPTQPAESLLVDKLVAFPGTQNTKGGVSSDRFVDNLSANDLRFAPNSRVLFRIKVKNTSGVTLKNVTMRDFIPDYMEPVGGPGNYDENTRTITYVIPEIKAGEEKVYDFEMQLVAQNKLPADKGIVCVINKVEAFTDMTRDEDASQLCVEKSVQGITTVPKTGPGLGLLVLAGNVLGLGAGAYLRRMKMNK